MDSISEVCTDDNKSVLMKMTIHVNRKTLKISRNGIQSVYIRFNCMWLVFMNKKLHAVYKTV